MAGVHRTLALLVAAYVLCPTAILVARANALCGASVMMALASMVGAKLYADRQREVLRWQRLTHGLCAECGYDLRETPLRCPECGSAP